MSAFCQYFCSRVVGTAALLSPAVLGGFFSPAVAAIEAEHEEFSAVFGGRGSLAFRGGFSMQL